MPYSVPDPQQTTFASLFLHLPSLLPLSISLYIHSSLPLPPQPTYYLMPLSFLLLFLLLPLLSSPHCHSLPFININSSFLFFNQRCYPHLPFVSEFHYLSVYKPLMTIPAHPFKSVSIHQPKLLHHPPPLLHFIPSLSLLITLLFLPSSPLPLFYHRLCNSSPSISASFSPALPAFPFPSPSPLLCFMLYLPFHFLPLPPLANPRIFFAAT